MTGRRAAPPTPMMVVPTETPRASWASAWRPSIASRVSPADVLLPIAVGLWIAAVAGVRVQAINDFGLLPALPPVFFASLFVLLASLISMLAAARPSTWRLAVHIVALVVMLQGLIPVVLLLPQYAYVFKHFGVVEYIALHGSVNDQIDIYQNWPGFFALAAWFDQLAGVSTPIPYAAWSPVYFGLLALMAIYASLRALAVPTRTRWLALSIFVVGNWIGQDYFAPQAFAFVLSQFVIAGLLTWFRGSAAIWVGKLEERLRRLLRGSPERSSYLVTVSTETRQRTVLLIAVFGIFAVTTFSHQLSPYMVITGAAALTVSGLLRPRWIVLVFTLIAGAYLLLRLDFLRSHEDLLLSFDPFRNAQNPEATPNEGVLGRVVTGYAARGLSALIWLLALGGFIRGSRSGRSVLALLALMLAPVLIIFGQEYGGEAIYRVYLFGLPWAACLAAFALAPLGTWTRWTTARIGVALGMMALLFLQAYFGLAEINQVRPTEVAASQYFYDHARPGSVLVLAAPNYPERSSGYYDRFVVTSGAFDPKLVPNPAFLHRNLGSGDLPAIEALVRSYSPHGYLAITTGMKIYAHVFKLLPDGSLDHLDGALDASPRWKVFFRNQDAVIYEFVGQSP